MAAGLARPILLLVLTFGVALPPSDQEPKTAFEKYLSAGIEAEQAGHYADAEKQYSAAIAEARKSPRDAPRLGLALSNLAGLYSQTGEEAKALALMKQALAADERALGPTDARVVNDLNNLAVYSQDGEAERLYKRAIRIIEQNPEVSDYQKTNVLRNLSELYRRQHRYAECEPLLQRAVEITQTSSELWNPQEVVEMRRSLADVYRQEGKEKEAQELELSAYEGVRRLGSPEANSIGAILEQAEDSLREGKLIAAEARFGEVIAATENPQGPLYASIRMGALNGLGRVNAAGGRDEEAEDAYLRAFEVHEQSASLGYPWMASDLGNVFDLEALYRKQGRLWEMEPIYERALAVQEKVLGPEDAHVADTLHQFGHLYFEEEKFRDALPLYARALRIREKDWGPIPKLAEALDEYAGVLKAAGDDDESSAFHARAQAIRKQASPNKP